MDSESLSKVAKFSYENKFESTEKTKEELEKFLKENDIIINKKNNGKKKSPKNNSKEQLWLQPEEYKKRISSGELLCAYAPIRGVNIKNKVCGIPMTAEDLERVNGDKLELRCSLCHVGNPPRPKQGGIKNLLDENAGKIAQPTLIPGVTEVNKDIKNVMGFLSGSVKIDKNETYNKCNLEKVDNLKESHEIFKQYKWIVKDKTVVIGKVTDVNDIKENYEEFLVELSGDELDKCKNIYNLKYEFNKMNAVDEVDILNSLEVN